MGKPSIEVNPEIIGRKGSGSKSEMVWKGGIFCSPWPAILTAPNQRRKRGGILGRKIRVFTSSLEKSLHNENEEHKNERKKCWLLVRFKMNSERYSTILVVSCPTGLIDFEGRENPYLSKFFVSWTPLSKLSEKQLTVPVSLRCAT